MATVRDLKVRITAVGNIRQITRAMEMVATTKLRRFQARALASRPYALEIEELIKTLAAHIGGGGDHELFVEREVKRTGLLVVTSDRGLCGAYNSNVFAKLREFQAANGDLEYHVIGKKGMRYLTRRVDEVKSYFEAPPLERMDHRDAAHVAQYFVKRFVDGEIDEVKVLYTKFMSMARYVPTVLPFLPLTSVGQDDEGSGVSGQPVSGQPASGQPVPAQPADVILEPDPATIFGSLIPKYLETRMYNLLIESLTSEYASRRVSMKNATDAATDMGSSLKLMYNRLRQDRITKELLDLIGGSEALRG